MTLLKATVLFLLWESLATASKVSLCTEELRNRSCAILKSCKKINFHELACQSKAVAMVHELMLSSLILDLSFKLSNSVKEGHFELKEMSLHMEVPDSFDNSYSSEPVDLSIPSSQQVVDLLDNFYSLKVLMCFSTTNIDYAQYVTNSEDVILSFDILWSVNWWLSIVDAQCDDQDVLTDSWYMLKDKVNLTHLALHRCHLSSKINIQRQNYLHKLEIVNSVLHDASKVNSDLYTLPRGMSNLKKLRELDLSGNPLHISPSLFATLLSLPNVKMLSLSRTNITSVFQLEPILNTSCLQLSALQLSGCQLSSLQEDELKLLSHQIHLRLLDLSNNSLYKVPSNWTTVPTNIKTVNLSSNLLSSVTFHFQSHVSLEVIDISKNNISTIGDILISGKTLILNVSYNKINEVIGLNYSQNIKHLNLSYNSIQSLTNHAVSSFSSLQSIDLGRNLLNCRICNITILQKWIKNKPNVSIMALNHTQNLLCAYSEHPQQAVVDVNQDECEDDVLPANPKWARVFTISLVISLIFLTVVLLHGYQFETCYLMQLWQNRTDESDVSDDSEFHQYDVFICYSNADREWVVNELIFKLEAAPHFYRFCDHERDFTLGSYITNNVLQAMRLSRHVLLILSESFFNSQWCIWELEMAKHREFENGGNSPILLQLKPFEWTALSNSLNSLLNASSILPGPENPLYLERLVSILGPSLAHTSEQ